MAQNVLSVIAIALFLMTVSLVLDAVDAPPSPFVETMFAQEAAR